MVMGLYCCSMKGVAQYKRESETNNRSLHGLEEGDEVSNTWGTLTVAEVDDDGVRFENGEVADHRTVAINMDDTNATVN